MKLYELSESMNQVAAMIEDGVEGLEEALESIEWTFAQKAEGCMKLRQSKLGEADVIAAEIARLQAREAKLRKDAEWLRTYVEGQMLAANMTEVKSALFKIKLAVNPPKVEVLNASLLPERYVRRTLTTAPDKTAIKEALKAGENVPGAKLVQDMKLRVG